MNYSRVIAYFCVRLRALTTHKYARTLESMKNEMQRPEGALIETAAAAKGMSGRKAAHAAGLSDARWRQIVNGFVTVGVGQKVEVVAPDATLARMAQVLDVMPDQLREAGRPDAADLLLVITGMDAENDWHDIGTALDRLRSIRTQLDSVIAELAAGGGIGGDTAPKT